MGARLNKPAYGMNDAPRRCWNRVDAALRYYGCVPTRADQCCYAFYVDKKDLQQKTLQLALYRLAYSKFTGTPIEAISVSFYFVDEDLEIKPELILKTVP